MAKSLKESQKREDELVQQSADRLAVTRKDKGRKEDLEDSFEAWVRCCDEAEAAQEQKTLVEEELKQFCEIGVCGEKKEVVARKT